ncbi:MAG: NAD(P)/FAD-dependent oxidoreductase [Ruminococcus sp.]|nr:NAD(P)/FAD-dependent oxidoreductase [Ruminococcus sp.]
MRFDVIIIGGGASGSMAGITSARLGKKVAILEKNGFIGKKLNITGKGRCNVTNNCDIQQLMQNIPRNPKFLYSAFSMLSPKDVMDFFESINVPLKTERGNRVFPISDKATDVSKALEKELKRLGVKILEENATELLVQDGVCTGVKTNKNTYLADSVLIATGGKSYTGTGSTGDGYKFAQEVGHTVTKLVPSLVPIVSEEKYCSDMMGLSLKNVRLNLMDNDKCIYSELGEMLFTHFGVSGPLVLSASSHISKMQQNRYKIYIDLKPALSVDTLDKRIQRDFSENINKSFINSLNKLLPNKIIPVVAKLSGIKFDTKVNQITREQRLHLIDIIKNFPITIKDFRPLNEAIITSGGISVKEINPKTMQSKLVKGLFFSGEVIDVDAYTGGFNLQIAFSTGYVAGINM